VVRGEPFDIKIQIHSPSDEILFDEVHTETPEEGGVHEFQPPETGDYSICFYNTISGWSAKVIEFDLMKAIDEMEEIPVGKSPPAESVDVSNVEESIEKMKNAMQVLERHIHHLRGREAQHREITENTALRLLWMTILESCALLGMSIGQILYIRSIFSGSQMGRSKK